MQIKWPYLLLLLLVWSCGADSIDKDAILREMAAERIAKFRRNGLRDCRKEVMEVANFKADSLLLERARRMRLLVDRPPKPRRPGLPPARELSEALPLRPLFPYEVRFDAVLRQQLTLDSLVRDSLQFVDTLDCSDCYVWSVADFVLPQVWTQDSNPGTSPRASRSSDGLDMEDSSDTVLVPGIYPIYRLLCSLRGTCFEDTEYSASYRQQLYTVLLLRPRGLELCLERLDPESRATAHYIDPLGYPPTEEIDLEEVLRQIQQEIVDEELRQKLVAVVERAKGQ